jgi:hypothetical protein
LGVAVAGQQEEGWKGTRAVVWEEGRRLVVEQDVQMQPKIE